VSLVHGCVGVLINWLLIVTHDDWQVPFVVGWWGVLCRVLCCFGCIVWFGGVRGFLHVWSGFDDLL